MKKKNGYMFFVHLFFIIFSLCVILPFFIIVMLSLSRETDIVDYGYSVIPRHFSLQAYEFLFKDVSKLFHSILFTVVYAVLAPAVTVILCSGIGYSISSKSDFALKKGVMRYLIFTMLTGAGLIPTYIIYTKIYMMGNSFLVYLLPGAVSAWTIILFRTFFSQIPYSLVEAATIDGASQLQVLIKVIVPMSKPIIGTVYFTNLLTKWNDWMTTLYYVTDERLYTVQYFMQKVLDSAEFMKQAYQSIGLGAGSKFPTETLKFAMCVIAVLPVFAAFPYLQKYFSKGMAVGAVKE